MPAGYLAKKKPWVILPYHNGDLEAARRLVGWIRVLGRVGTTCVLLRDHRMRDDGGLVMIARHAFDSVVELRTPHSLPDERWPIGANWMFETGCSHMAKTGFPFLWLEPDAVPLRAGWFEAINAEYQSTAKLFMGTVVHSKDPKFPEKHLNGIAVYPSNAGDFFKHDRRHVAWDITTNSDVLDRTLDTPLIQHFWGELGLPPTFVPFHGKDDPKNALTLDFINARAVIFHRCKNDSLINLLREQLIYRPKFDPADVRCIWHVVQRFPQRNADAQRRIDFAFQSWVRLYGKQFRPVHVWEFPRTSLQIGDDRKLPYLKDVLEAALRRAGKDDALMMTNDDTVLHPEILPAVRERLGKQPAFCSFRLNYVAGRAPNLNLPVASIGKPADDDIGRDVFVFTVDWLVDHMADIPDFLLGELEWDLMLALMIRQSCGLKVTGRTVGRVEPVCELPKGYVWHERHERAWIKSGFYNPSKQHNWKLSAEWCAANQIEYPFE